MVAQDGKRQEGCPQSDFQHGYTVSELTLSHMMSKEGTLTICNNSICILTIVRVQQLAVFDPNNMSQGYAIEGALADLEPLLGIINACLTVLRPVLIHLFPGTMLPGTNKQSCALEEPSGVSNTSGMHKYKPYVSLNNTKSDMATATWSEAEVLRDDRSSHEDLMHQPTGIYVQNEWKVQ